MFREQRSKLPDRHVLLLAALLLAASASAAEEDSTAWQILSRVRISVALAAPLAANFDQMFVPPGFSSGDRERGRMTLALPECLRWDYTEPYPRSYLLCGRTAYSWNPGETAGRRQVLSPQDQRGLELVRLDVADLRAHYRATVEAIPGEPARILLEPFSPDRIRDAELSVDLETQRLLSLAFHDLEGNLTRFDFSDYRPSDQPSPFAPPAGMTWLDD